MDTFAIFLLGYVLGTHSILLMVMKILSNGSDKNRKPKAH